MTYGELGWRYWINKTIPNQKEFIKLIKIVDNIATAKVITLNNHKSESGVSGSASIKQYPLELFFDPLVYKVQKSCFKTNKEKISKVISGF